MGYRMAFSRDPTCSVAVLVIYLRGVVIVTNRRTTDGQTRDDSICRFSIESRGKNAKRIALM